MPEDKMVKVVMRGRKPEVESMWATAINGHLYRIENSPFYAYGVSWKDIAEALPGEDGALEFERVVEKSGHRTVRVILEKTSQSDAGKHILDQLVAMGCSWEGMNTRLICIDLPAAV